MVAYFIQTLQEIVLLFSWIKYFFLYKRYKRYIYIIYIYIYIYTIYTWLTISSCYDATPLTLGLIGMDSGLSTLDHSCGFACQQRMLKTFPGPGYLCSMDGVV